MLLPLLLLGAVPWPDGSVLVLENSNKPVSGYTGSAVTHVAMIANLGGEPWVYEATPARVRRLRWDRYALELGAANQSRSKPIRAAIMTPKVAYTDKQTAQLVRYLDSQLGRRYSVKGYVRGQKNGGIHCAEFSSSALAATGRFRVVENQRLSPGMVIDQIRPWYSAPTPITVTLPTAKTPWSTQVWNSVAAIQVWCTWACYEFWTLCW